MNTNLSDMDKFTYLHSLERSVAEAIAGLSQTLDMEAIGGTEKEALEISPTHPQAHGSFFLNLDPVISSCDLERTLGCFTIRGIAHPVFEIACCWLRLL